MVQLNILKLNNHNLNLAYQERKSKLPKKTKKGIFIIIDSDALLYRAYYALPPLKTEKGELVNAVYGFLLVFLKVIREFQPDYIASAFDFPAPTFRHRKFKEYKAKRLKAPEDLRQQFPKIKKILENFQVPVFEKKGFEADDIIASLKIKNQKGTNSSQPGAKIKNIIISGDLDLLQLVDKNTEVYFLKRGVKEAVLYDEKGVEEKYQGLGPKQLSDFKGLRGDSSDNIPGVFGIGPKTAIFLIKRFKTLENLYQELKTDSARAKEIKQSLRKKLLDSKEQAFVSKELSKIRSDAPINFNLKMCQWGRYNKEKIKEIFKEYQFETLINRLP